MWLEAASKSIFLGSIQYLVNQYSTSAGIVKEVAPTNICVIRYCLQCCRTVTHANIAPRKSLKMHYLSLANPGI